MNVPKPQFNATQKGNSTSPNVRSDPNHSEFDSPRRLFTADPIKPKNRNDLSSIYRPITTELAIVERIIKDEISSNNPWVQRLLEHNWIQGGKRIRPVLLLLSGATCGRLHDGHFYVAAAIELIHAATLVHDDVIDKAEVRRHSPTVNATWGDRASVLLGDFLFTHAFSVASQAKNTEVIKAIARSSNLVCEGEIRQNAWQGNFQLSESDYLAMIQDKTGELCSCSCFVGALLAGANQSMCEAFRQYGLKLGVAFQIIDDVLDLVGLQRKVGKTLGTDLSNQKPTLPILHSLRESSNADRTQLLDLLQNQPLKSAEIAVRLQQTGSIDYAYQVAKSHLEEALKLTQGLPDNDYSTALADLVNFVLNRAH